MLSYIVALSGSFPVRQPRLNRLFLALVLLPSIVPPCLLSQSSKQQPGPPAKSSAKEKESEKTAYAFSLAGPDGKDFPLATFKGKFLLIVNLARNSSYNDQLPALVKLSDLYKNKDLVVIGIPSDDFGAAEPGTAPEIAKAYGDAKVNFPVMAPSKLSGDAALPLVAYLTKSNGAPAGGAIHWNYTKFVVDKKGAVVARFDPDVTPDSLEMLSTLDQILRGAYKPPKKTSGKPEAEDGNDEP